LTMLCREQLRELMMPMECVQKLPVHIAADT